MKTYVPASQLAAVNAWDMSSLSYQDTGQRCDRFLADGGLKPGDALPIGRFDWEIHPAPGHDPDAVMLFEPEHRVLVTADALWNDGFGVVFPELVGTSAFEEVSATLERIRGLQPRLVVPGHGALLQDVEDALQRAHMRLSRMREQPDRHARHALKVLLKFHLMEVGQLSVGALRSWSREARLLRSLHERWADAVDFDLWIEQALTDLALAGAIKREIDVWIDA